MEHEFLYDNTSYQASVEQAGGGYKVTLGDKTYSVSTTALSGNLLSLIIDGRSVLAHTAKDDKGRIVCIGGVTYHLAEPQEDEAGSGGSQAGGDGLISTPMPGKIVAVHVQVGDTVKKDQPLIVVESMKMQNDILSDVNGVVKKVHFQPGDQASFGDPLVEIEKDED